MLSEGQKPGNCSTYNIYLIKHSSKHNDSFSSIFHKNLLDILVFKLYTNWFPNFLVLLAFWCKMNQFFHFLWKGLYTHYVLVQNTMLLDLMVLSLLCFFCLIVPELSGQTERFHWQQFLRFFTFYKIQNFHCISLFIPYFTDPWGSRIAISRSFLLESLKCEL